MLPSLLLAAAAAISPAPALAQDSGQEGPLVFKGGAGAGAGIHVVLIAGDEEYRSEEALPMLAKILSVHHGFRCTVLFSTDPETGAIDADNQVHTPHLETLADADLVILALRFREWRDEDMKHFVEYVESGKPIVGLRTSTHAFRYQRNKESPYARYGFRAKKWPGGFGRQVLGETWVAHHGGHGSQSTRGVIEEQNAGHPILRGVKDVWGPTDVYTVRHLPEDAIVLLRGAVLEGMKPEDAPVSGPKNEPMMPLVWAREHEIFPGKTSRVVCSTLGAADDLTTVDSWRLFLNAALWAVGREDKIKDDANAATVGVYKPTPFGFGRWVKGVMPAWHALSD